MPRPDVSSERREQIIEAAVATFVRLGLSDARMEDIAAEAGLSKGTLYLYFDSKDALTGAILESVLARELAEARRLLETERSATEKLEALIDIIVEDSVDLLPLLPLYFELLSMSLRQETVREVLQQPFNDYLEIVMAVVEQGKAEGEFRDVDSKAAALALGTLIDGTLLLWGYDPQLIEVNEQMRASIGLLLDGLKIQRREQ